MVRTLVARLAAAMVLAITVQAATSASSLAAARHAPPAQLHVFSGPAGSTLALTAVADSGNAVGNVRLASGRHEGVFWNGSRLVGARDTLGVASSLTAINDRDDIAGWTATNATATATDVVSGTGAASAMPHALFLARGGKVRVLPDPSVATAVNLADVVVGVFRAADGKTHGFAWNNGPPPRRAKLSAMAAPPGFVDLGVGSADGENDFGDIVGQLNGVAGWWTLGANRKYTFVSAGFPGELMAINIHRYTFGSQADPMTGGSGPVVAWDVGKPVTKVALNPFQKGADFFAGALSDGPLIAAGQLGPQGDQQPLVGVLATRQRFIGFDDPQRALAPALRRSYRIRTVAGASIGGTIAGSADVRGGQTAAMLLVPTVADMLDHAGIDLIEAQGVYRDLQLAPIARAIGLVGGSHINRACQVLTRVRRHFGADAGSAASDDAHAFYDHVYWAIWAAQTELRCGKLPALAYRPFAGRPPLSATP